MSEADVAADRTTADPTTADPTTIDLFDFIGFVRARWLAVVAGAVIGGVAAFVYLNLATAKYAAALRVSPAAAATTGGLGSTLGQLSGLAAIAGVDVRQGSSAASPFDLYLDAIHSRQTADVVARDPAIMHHLFAAQWDGAARRWHPAPSLTRPVMDVVRGLAGQPAPAWHPPDGGDIADYIAKKLAIQPPKPKDPPVTTLYLEDRDPQFAVRFLNLVDAISDDAVRRRALVRATEYARYLKGRLAGTENSEQVKRLADILLEQDRAIMLASSSVPFAANPSEPAVATSRPVSPIVPLIVAVGIVGGLLLALALLFVRFVTRRDLTATAPRA